MKDLVLSAAGSSPAPPDSVYLSDRERATLLTKAFLYYSGNHADTIRHAGCVVAQHAKARQRLPASSEATLR